MEGCVQPEGETGEPQTYGRWKDSQGVTKHSISMKVGWHQMKLAQGRFTTKSSSSPYLFTSSSLPVLAELQNFLPENTGWKLTRLPKETFREETYQIQIITYHTDLHYFRT